MKDAIEQERKEPIYLRLYRRVRDDIINGSYPYHTKLPSKRTIADEWGISTITVEHAYALLSEEGYIEARQRSGYFVIFRNGEGFTPAGNDNSALPPPPAYSLTPDFPFSVLAKRMRGVITDYGEAILEPSPGNGTPILREALRQYLARNRGIHAEASQIIIGSGAEYLYHLIVGLFGREHHYAVESPCYQKIEQVYRNAGLEPEQLPLGQDGIESEALWSSKADILHVSPFRSFPSGVTATVSKKHEYLRWASHGKYLIEDDFESEFSVSSKPEETLYSHTDQNNVIYMNTFSKTVSPSLRVGYMVLPPHLAEIFKKRLGFYSCTVPTFIQYVLAELLTKGDFERHINRVRRKKRKGL